MEFKNIIAMAFIIIIWVLIAWGWITANPIKPPTDSGLKALAFITRLVAIAVTVICIAILLI